jgi:hypothetical protein
VTSTVDGPLYQGLLDALSAGSLPLSKIVGDGRFAATPPADLGRNGTLERDLLTLKRILHV